MLRWFGFRNERNRQRDVAAEVEAIKRRLIEEGLPDRAGELDDAVAGGATGTEIIGRIGLVLSGWTSRDSTVQLSPETRRMVGDLAHYLKNRFRN